MRRWNVDPEPNMSLSPYATFQNNPIWFADPLGDTVKPFILDYKPVFKAGSGSMLQKADNAASNIFSFAYNNTIGAVAGFSADVYNTFTNQAASGQTNIMYEFDKFQKSAYDYHTGTSFGQQARDAGNTITDLHTFDLPVQLLIAHRLLPNTRPSLKVAASVEDKMAPLNLGNKVHYDPLNGKPSLPPALPTELSNRYPLTDFSFPRRGQVGADVKVIGGAHPSTYSGSFWNPTNLFGDFKPGNANGAKTFKAEVKSGKLPPNTQMLPYDPKTGKLQ